MKMRSIGRKGLEISKGNLTITTLNYPKWYSMRANAKLTEGQLEIVGKSAFSSTYYFTLNGVERGSMSSNWKGQTFINVDWGTSGRTTQYIFRHRGFLGGRFEVTDQHEKLLFTLKTKWNWSTWSHDYEVQQHTQFDEDNLPELLLYCGHAARLHAQRQAAAS